jgi:hypothetical protein
MHLLLPLLALLALPAAAPPEGHCPGAAEVFHCTFDSHWDSHYDGWPQGWTRRSGPGFPQYVGIKMHRDPAPESRSCLRVELNGGGATAYSPPLPIDPLLSYVLEGSLRVEGLQHDRAHLSITFLDKNHHKLRSFDSPRLAADPHWQKLRLGPVPADPEAALALVGLHVEPQGEQEDLRGTVSFSDIWLGSLPRLTLCCNRPSGVLAESQTALVTCTASGRFAAGADVKLRLEDRGGRPLATVRRTLRNIAKGPSLRGAAASWSGRAHWELPLPGPGFYRVQVDMADGCQTAGRSQLSLAVVTPCPLPAASEFGWSVPHGARPLAQPLLAELLAQAGVHWVKYPLWDAGCSGHDALEQTVAFRETLDAQGIELVGLLSNPPPAIRDQCQLKTAGGDEAASDAAPAAAELFAAGPSVWYPSLEPVMLRLATQVRWWQLGTDRDTSFVGSPNLAAKITEVKAALDRIGQDVHVGMGWDWREPLPVAAKAGLNKNPWRFLTLSAQPPLTAEALAAQLDAKCNAAVARWVVLAALPKGDHAPAARAEDLVTRMMVAKMHGAEGIFCPDPFDPQCGLMEPDGTPGELFLPWRTTALMLGGAKYLGVLDLPGGSGNALFSRGLEARGPEAVLVVWNPRPQTELVSLGPNLRQLDLWGQASVPPSRDQGQVIRVDCLPSFVTGVSAPLALWQVAVALAKQQIPSIPGRPYANNLRVKNTFADAVEANVKLTPPDGWRVEPKELRLRLAGGADSQQPLTMTLPPGVISGQQSLRLDFEIRADRTYSFHLKRPIDVGGGDVGLQGAVRLNERGQLEVRQTIVNQGKQPISFRCGLLAPDRRRQANEVIAAPGDPDVKVYLLPDGRELLGKTLWLRAEEVDGERVLNCKMTAAQNAVEDSADAAWPPR